MSKIRPRLEAQLKHYFEDIFVRISMIMGYYLHADYYPRYNDRINL